MRRWVLATGLGLLLVVPVAACEDESLSGPTVEPAKFGQGDSGTTPPAQVLGPPKADAGADDAGPDSSTPNPAPACGDDHIDPGETCDPLASCPTECRAVGCMVRKLELGGTCGARCVDDTLVTECKNGDGCCPPTCNNANDSDCSAACGNGVVEVGELCDGDTCPTACAPIGCQLRALTGTGCNVQCASSGTISACESGDGCCPAGCNATNDSDCSVTCNNGTVEADETCDPIASCPTVCAPIGCMLRKVDKAGTCQAACVDDKLIDVCKNGDGCCPPACNANNDSDCAPKCGNGAVESGETCDPLASCPKTCPMQGCQMYELKNDGTCQAACVAGKIQESCVNGDGCCPSGCNANNDNDCKAACGNDVVEPGETCDGPRCPIACPTPKDRCVESRGSAKECTLQCSVPVQCTLESDGCCSFGSDGACGGASDKDCRGEKWEWLEWPDILDLDARTACVDIRVFGIEPGASYDFTTCAPPGSSGVGDLDPDIVQVTDDVKNEYPEAVDEACASATALPRLAKSECRNKSGAEVMACGSPTAAGFQAKPGASSMTVRICRHDKTAPGKTPLYIWYNASKKPQKG